MDITASLLHLLAFVLPAVGVALATALGARWWIRGAGRLGWWLEWAVLSAVGIAVLVAGLVVTGRDGKMLTYAALVLACATAQWALLRPASR